MMKNNTIENNPLDLESFQCRSANRNKSGRPLKDNMVRFGPQHQSFVSKLLKNYYKDDLKLLTNDSKGLSTDSEYIHDLTNNDDILLEGNHSSIIIEVPNLAMPTKKNQNGEYSCDYANCSYSTKLSSNLKKHKRTHSSEKPYLCDMCPFQSKFINSLKTHKRTHTNERPYNCIFCSYRCNSSSNLKKHCKHMHSNNFVLET
ncbi:unnamed protein product [Chilo suppressalis]|uniref:C2H2-type domain-containing protein n=1 Tax=Chilo suppressalis TaxID=168631 RepID=A0ABN8BC84_CHISP|nr:hypothetical protein evm_011925 [Chilo suppressalis]CAH0405870.1 unnamed protein product [Chilo suppressalis]